MTSGLAMDIFWNFWKPQRWSSNWGPQFIFIKVCFHSVNTVHPPICHIFMAKKLLTNRRMHCICSLQIYNGIIFHHTSKTIILSRKHNKKSLFLFRFFLFFIEPCQSLSLISYSCELILNGNKVTRSFKSEWKSRDVSLSG